MDGSGGWIYWRKEVLGLGSERGKGQVLFDAYGTERR